MDMEEETAGRGGGVDGVGEAAELHPAPAEVGHEVDQSFHRAPQPVSFQITSTSRSRRWETASARPGWSALVVETLGPYAIRVNALLPGIVEGERIRRVIAARAATQGVPYEEMERRYLGQVSLRRMVTPADVAAMVLFLCSPAGCNISGQSLGVCGNVESLR